MLDLHFHQRHPERILFQGPGFYFWVTEDFGRTYKALPTPGEATLGFWMELKVHPNVPDWLLAKVKRKECLADLSSAACAHDLFISKARHTISCLPLDVFISACYMRCSWVAAQAANQAAACHAAVSHVRADRLWC